MYCDYFSLIKGESVHDVVEDGEFGDDIVQESTEKKEVLNIFVNFSVAQYENVGILGHVN